MVLFVIIFIAVMVIAGAVLAGITAQNISIATGSKAWGKAVMSGYIAIFLMAMTIVAIVHA